MMGWPDYAGGSGLMVVLMLIVVAITAGVVVVVVSGLIRGPHPGDPPVEPTAREVIDLRLASNEIDEDEYLRLLSLLSSR